MSDIAAATGTRTQAITHDGQEYTVTPATNKMKGYYTSFLEIVRMQTTHRMNIYLSPDEQQLNLSGSMDACGVLKTYEWGSRPCMLSLDTADGRSHMLWLCLQKHQPNITKNLAREIYEAHTEEVLVAFAVLMPTVFFYGRPGESNAAEDAAPKVPTPGDLIPSG